MKPTPPKEKTKVSVTHEWGTLKEVFIGQQPVANNMKFPEKGTPMPPFMPDRTADLAKNYPNEKYIDVCPTILHNFQSQANDFARLATEHSVYVRRNSPLPAENQEILISDYKFLPAILFS